MGFRFNIANMKKWEAIKTCIHYFFSSKSIFDEIFILEQQFDALSEIGKNLYAVYKLRYHLVNKYGPLRPRQKYHVNTIFLDFVKDIEKQREMVEFFSGHAKTVWEI